MSRWKRFRMWLAKKLLDMSFYVSPDFVKQTWEERMEFRRTNTDKIVMELAQSDSFKKLVPMALETGTNRAEGPLAFMDDATIDDQVAAGKRVVADLNEQRRILDLKEVSTGINILKDYHREQDWKASKK